MSAAIATDTATNLMELQMTDQDLLEYARRLVDHAGLPVPEAELRDLAQVLPDLWQQAAAVSAVVTATPPVTAGTEEVTAP